MVPIDYVEIFGAGGKMTVPVYLVDLLFTGTALRLQSWRVSQIADVHFDVLVGMDLISQGDFSISHTSTTTIFSFCWPTLKRPLNHVQEIEAQRREDEATQKKAEALAQRRKGMQAKKLSIGKSHKKKR